MRGNVKEVERINMDMMVGEEWLGNVNAEVCEA